LHFFPSCHCVCNPPAEKLLQDIKEIGEISGIARLRKKALSEASLLRGSSGPLRKAQLLGSNLASLRAVMDLVRERAGHVTAVEKRFTLPEDQEDEDGDEGVSHVIDVVADGGLTWYKVGCLHFAPSQASKLITGCP
jgi:hypothetical protein